MADGIYSKPPCITIGGVDKGGVIFVALFRPCSKFVLLNDSTDVSHEWVVTYDMAVLSYLQ